MTTPRAPYLGDPGCFERLVHDLVLDPEVQSLGLEADLLLAQTPGGIVVIARLRPEVDQALAGLVERLRSPGATVLLAGWGSEPGISAIARLSWANASWLDVMHVADDEAVWPESPGERSTWLYAWLRRRPAHPPDWERFWLTVAHHQTTLRGQDADFRKRLAANPPWATRVLVATMVLIFGAELLVHAPDDTEALVNMGALWPDAVAAGQVWRILTATLLHGSVAHAAMNLYVLWRLGNLLERILGTARFIVLYTVAGIGGSLLSLVFLHGLSVGASGAIWGLMAGQFVLALRGDGVLPDQLRTAMRSSSGQNLMLNLLISFMPGVDWAAHAGGGVTGALAALLLGASLRASAVAPLWVRAVAVLCTFFLLAGVAMTLLGAILTRLAV